MNIHFTEATSLASIDRQLQDQNSHLSPAQYEIIRQVIYHTGDFEYSSLVKFSPEVLSCGLNALTLGLSVVVDVPEIQVNIVPKLQQSFCNPVYCCATTGKKSDQTKTKTGFGLINLARQHQDGIFLIGQDLTAWQTLLDLIKQGSIDPSLAILTVPFSWDVEVSKYLASASIPVIYIDGTKGGATVASAIFNCLVQLAWRVNR